MPSTSKSLRVGGALALSGLLAAAGSASAQLVASPPGPAPGAYPAPTGAGGDIPVIQVGPSSYMAGPSSGMAAYGMSAPVPSNANPATTAPAYHPQSMPANYSGVPTASPFNGQGTTAAYQVSPTAAAATNPAMQPVGYGLAPGVAGAQTAGYTVTSDGRTVPNASGTYPASYSPTTPNAAVGNSPPLPYPGTPPGAAPSMMNGPMNGGVTNGRPSYWGTPAKPAPPQRQSFFRRLWSRIDRRDDGESSDNSNAPSAYRDPATGQYYPISRPWLKSQ